MGTEPAVNKIPRFYSTGWQLSTGLWELARLIYANYLVLAKTDLKVHFQYKLLEKRDDFNLRSGTKLKQIDGAQRQLYSFKIRKDIADFYWSYC